MTQDEAKALVEKHGNKKAAAMAIGMSESAFGRLVRGQAKSTGSASAQKTGKSLADFRQQYDKDFIIPTRVKAALKELGGGWEYEVQFAKVAGVSLADLGNYRDQFIDHVVTLKESRRVWAGTVQMAETMRGMI
jgi:hypothetical protein